MKDCKWYWNKVVRISTNHRMTKSSGYLLHYHGFDKGKKTHHRHKNWRYRVKGQSLTLISKIRWVISKWGRQTIHKLVRGCPWGWSVPFSCRFEQIFWKHDRDVEEAVKKTRGDSEVFWLRLVRVRNINIWDFVEIVQMSRKL